MDTTLLTGHAQLGGVTRLIEAMSSLVSDRGLGVAIVIVLLVASLFGAWKLWGAGRKMVAWLGDNLVKPVVTRHSKFLDDMTVSNRTIEASVGEIKTSVQHFEGLLTRAECRYPPQHHSQHVPGQTHGPQPAVNRRPPEASG